MLGSVLLIERPLEVADQIVGLAMVEERVVVFNHHYWRSFSLKGEQMYEEHFTVDLPIILEMRFVSSDFYVAVFWTGDYEYTDRRIEILVSKNKVKSEVLITEQAYCLQIEGDIVTAYILLPDGEDTDMATEVEDEAEES